mmetsp:Transcript_50268/g.104925  ORF Transcript_50268/g.104925 Transcript_50268/m.104925 type:complete len:94 (+) Transcript_50268:60-341(+)
MPPDSRGHRDPALVCTSFECAAVGASTLPPGGNSDRRYRTKANPPKITSKQPPATAPATAPAFGAVAGCCTGTMVPSVELEDNGEAIILLVIK